MEFTSDNGLTWERTSALNERSTGAIQPTILKHPGGKLQLLCRSTVSKILSAWSNDNGRTWSNLEPIALPNNNSGIDAVTLKDGRHILIYNHLVKGRYALHAAISKDGIRDDLVTGVQTCALPICYRLTLQKGFLKRYSGKAAEAFHRDA